VIYEVKNLSPSPRVIEDGITGRLIRIMPGQTVCEDLGERVVSVLRNRGATYALSQVGVTQFPAPEIVAPSPQKGPGKPPLHLVGMFGIGDCLHQRAMLREKMKTHTVWLDTPHWLMYWDLHEQGLKLCVRNTNLHAQAKTLARERGLFRDPLPSARTPVMRIGYNADLIRRFGGTITAAICGGANVAYPKYPDFSFPLKPEWVESARKLIATWGLGGKPLLVYRPNVLRKEWDGSIRAPDAGAYNQIYQTIKDRFFVVSLADLRPSIEWITGEEMPADVKLHHGELDFQTMAALFKEADMVLTPAGFGPVLSQAVGTSVIIVYGCGESYHNTDVAGEHLAPTLGIDPDKACGCYSRRGTCAGCSKRITMAPALARVEEFVGKVLISRNLPQVTPTEVGATEVKFAAGNFFNKMEREVLVALVGSVEPTRVVEFGCNEGGTAKLLMEHVPTIKKYVGIDVPLGYVTPHPLQRNEIPKVPGKNALGLPGFELMVRPRGSYDVRAEEIGEVDVAFIDGDHSKEGVVNDTNLALACVRPGGIIIWHDYYIFDPVPKLGVKPALDEFLASGRDLKHVKDTWLAFERIKEVVPDASIEATPAVLGPIPEPLAPSILIIHTIYADSQPRVNLLDQCLTIDDRINADCDVLVVDSQSPLQLPLANHGEWVALPASPDLRAHRMLFNFPDNIGHLSRRNGRDGWGRATCKGLEAAINGGWDYTFVIEGDSLFRLPVRPIVEQMAKDSTKVISIPVTGATGAGSNKWVETGLMAFNVEWLRTKNFVGQYDWPRRKAAPTPEIVVRNIVWRDLKWMPWKGMRKDKNQITVENLDSLNLDWITHCNRDADGGAAIYDKFMELNLCKNESALTEVAVLTPTSAPVSVFEPRCNGQGTSSSTAASSVRVNLGYGTNRLPGWDNHDADVDISKSLPWPDNHADFILAEHVVEHVSLRDAVAFFKECWRVLKPTGVLRITVPSVERIMRYGDQDYFKFTTKFQKNGATVRGAMGGILYEHGHQMAYTETLLESLVYYAGFKTTLCRPGSSEHAELRGVEGHGKVIGQKFNDIESICCEGTVDGKAMLAVDSMAAAPVPVSAPQLSESSVAVVVGGAMSTMAEYDMATKMCADAGMLPVTFVVNDMIEHFPHHIDHAVTLHPDKLRAWLGRRGNKNKPRCVWAHKACDGATNHTKDWNGSVGLFAVKIARELGHEKILLCGVPMDPKDKHFVRKVEWAAAKQFKHTWDQRKKEIAPYVRSFSGWTAQILGAPTINFLRNGVAVRSGPGDAAGRVAALSQ
jgi:hypothetical protein